MKSLKIIVPGLFLAICLQAFADGDRAAFREAKQLCAKEVGVVKPADGSRLKREDREKIKACLTAKGIARPERKNKGPRGEKGPKKGHKRSEEEKSKIDACLVSKGITLKK